MLKSIVDSYFFSAKECALAAYDEYTNQSMSKKLDEKIAKHMSEKKDQDDASLREKDDEKEPLAQKFEEGLA